MRIIQHIALILIAVSVVLRTEHSQSDVANSLPGKIDMPEPISGRVGHVGGVESIVVDGKRWYFGFDFGLDLVVSPLIEDAETMSQFASEYMLQTDGKHDPEYWRELVEISVSDSELTDNLGRDFSSRALTDFIHGLNQTEATKVPLNTAIPSYHLRYLLMSSTGWDIDILADEELKQFAKKANLDLQNLQWDVLDLALKIVVENSHKRDDNLSRYAAKFIKRLLALILQAAPPGWREEFGVLSTGV